MQEIHSYDCSKQCTGLYIDVNGTGREYNVLLLVQAYSKRSRKGKIVVSTKPFPDCIKVKREDWERDIKHYNIVDWNNYIWPVFNTAHITLAFTRFKNKKLYIRVIPNTKS